MKVILGTVQRCNLTSSSKMEPLSGIVLMHLRCNYVVCLTIIMSQFITKGNFWKRVWSAVRKQISVSPREKGTGINLSGCHHLEDDLADRMGSHAEISQELFKLLSCLLRLLSSDIKRAHCDRVIQIQHT